MRAELFQTNWKRALINFEYVINANHKNPFAYYYAAKAAKKPGRLEKAAKYYDEYKSIRKDSESWAEVFQRFIEEAVEFSEI